MPAPLNKPRPTPGTAATLLNQAGQDSFPTARVVGKLLFVVAMFAQGPDGHLVHPGRGEQRRRQALRHQREAHPAEKLVGVVGTGDRPEQAGERVAGGLRDSADAAARRPQLPQRPVDAEVAQFAHLWEEQVAWVSSMRSTRLWSKARI